MPSEANLLKNFCASTGCTFVERHYPEFPLDAKIVRDGKTVAAAQLTSRTHGFYAHPLFRHTIWKFDEGKEASEDHKISYIVLCAFTDCEAFYEYDPKHKYERMDGKGATPREQSVIAGSLFIPMTHLVKFDGKTKLKWTPRVVAPKPHPSEEWVEGEFVEEEFTG